MMAKTRNVFLYLAGIFSFLVVCTFVRTQTEREENKKLPSGGMLSAIYLMSSPEDALLNSMYRRKASIFQMPAPVGLSAEDTTELPAKELTALQEIMKERLAAVVQIRLVKSGHDRFGSKQLEDFFLPENHDAQNGTLSNEREVGTGFVVTPDGFIVTARHLLTNVDEVHVILHNGSRLPAKFIGADLRSEVAVLKVEASDLPVIALDDLALPRAGQFVFAIGSPMSADFRNSITMGIVSAVQQNASDTSVSENSASYWLTDVAMNPGNSGGPLINLKGQFMGMATIPYAGVNTFSGLATVISAHSVIEPARRIIAKGSEGHARLGIQYGPVASLQKKGAAQIVAVEPGSSASEAGLKKGDVILAIDGASLEDHLDLSEEIEQKAPGDVITLTIQRGMDALSMQIRLKALKEATRQTAASAPQDILMSELGFTVDDLSMPLIYDLGLPVTEGVVVLYVNPGSVAYREGDIRGGMVIVEMAGEEIGSKADFVRVFNKIKPGDTAMVKLYRPYADESMLTALVKPF